MCKGSDGPTNFNIETSWRNACREETRVYKINLVLQNKKIINEQIKNNTHSGQPRARARERERERMRARQPLSFSRTASASGAFLAILNITSIAHGRIECTHAHTHTHTLSGCTYIKKNSSSAPHGSQARSVVRIKKRFVSSHD